MSELAINPIKAIIGGDFDDRIHALSPDDCTFELARNRIETWRELGRFSVFNAGTFDVLTANHVLSLVQCRALGAMARLDMAKIETLDDQRAVHEVAASNDIHLMITLDTNRALEESKSRRPEKGGAPKPTLDWLSRATMLAMQSIPSPDEPARRRSSVDYITRHGPDCCEVCSSGTCVNEDNALMTVRLQPDLVVVNSESRNTITDLERYKEEGLLPNTQIAVIVEKENQYTDPLLDGGISTTEIIRRIRS